jgi:hypothetical protein
MSKSPDPAKRVIMCRSSGKKLWQSMAEDGENERVRLIRSNAQISGQEELSTSVIEGLR